MDDVTCMTKHAQQASVTAEIVAELVGRRYETLSTNCLEIARQCVLDWLGVTVAAVDEPLVRILLDDVAEQGGTPHASILGGGRGTVYDAALVNGSAGHALDFDDVSFAMTTHPSAVILPALLALAQSRKASGRSVLASYVAGYEAGSRIGMLVAPGHYEAGFHGTATIGTFAAAAACAHVLELDAEHTAHAIGIAATQAAGIRCMFGTMCKPLHAGKAAQNGLRAAVLAGRGYESRTAALEGRVGFAVTHSPDFSPEKALATPEGGYFLYQNLFKYHASCYLTHSIIDNVLTLKRDSRLDPNAMRSLTVTIHPSLDTVCNIAKPQTGLESKFSLRQCGAFALAGIDTGRLETFADDMAGEPRVAALRDKIAVKFDDSYPRTFSEVVAELESGERLTSRCDSDAPEHDLALQKDRLIRKFRGLMVPRTGETATERAIDLIARLDAQSSVDELLQVTLEAPALASRH